MPAYRSRPPHSRPALLTPTLRFLTRIVVNYVSLTAGLLLITLVSNIGDFLSGNITAEIDLLRTLWLPLAIFGMVLSLIHIFVRPTLSMLTGQWMLRTFGAFALLVDMFIVTVSIHVSPFPLPFDHTAWWGIPVATALFDLIALVLTELIGINRPYPAGQREHAALWRILDRRPQARRSWLRERVRQQEVQGLIMRYAVEIFTTGGAIGHIRRRCSNIINGPGNALDGLSTSAKFRVMLEELGPTYVKFGQMLSSQTQQLPSEWVTELQRLQANAPAVPFDEVRQVIVAELGGEPDTLFAEFDREPVAAASMAQVHRARLSDGTPLAVKVQRPHIVASVKADLGVLEDVVELLESVSKQARSLGVAAMLREFSAGVIRELDYRNEAYHAVRMAENMADLPHIRVPAVYPELSSERVLTLEFMEGVSVNTPGALDAVGLDGAECTQGVRGAQGACANRDDIATSFIRALTKQMFIDGFFHGDPHAGNILLNPATGDLAFIDLGLVGRLDRNKRLELIDLLLSIQQNDSAGLAAIAMRLTTQTRPVDKAVLRDDLGELVNRYLRYTKTSTFSTVTLALAELLQQHGMVLDPQFTLAIKALAQSEEFILALGTEVDFVAVAVTEVKHLTLSSVTPESVVGQVKQQVLGAGRGLMRRLPDIESAVESWADQALAGKLTVHVDTSDLKTHVDSLGTIASRAAAALIVTGMIVSTAIVSMVNPGLQGLYIVLFIVGVGGAWRLIRSPRKRAKGESRA